jgi:hypothetical protein
MAERTAKGFPRSDPRRLTTLTSAEASMRLSPSLVAITVNVKSVNKLDCSEEAGQAGQGRNRPLQQSSLHFWSDKTHVTLEAVPVLPHSSSSFFGLPQSNYFSLGSNATQSKVVQRYEIKHRDSIA